MRRRDVRDRRESERFRRQVHGSRAGAELAALFDDVSVTVDARGTFCPEPLIRTQEAARQLRAGDLLLLVADDAGVEVDIPAWCMSTGNEYLGGVREPARIRLLVRIGRARSGTRLSRSGR